MTQKSRKPVRGMLQTWEMVEITGSAEIAALQRRIRVAEKSLGEREKTGAAHEKSQVKRPAGSV